jgi:hypothetical protein
VLIRDIRGQLFRLCVGGKLQVAADRGEHLKR